MISIQECAAYCDQLLALKTFEDYCPNGLQVEGGNQLSHIVSGVTASEAFIRAAVARGADTLLVHHGYFWKNEASVITGMKKRRIALLIENNINLLAYHLPLDAHPLLGNNAQLAKVLGINNNISHEGLVFFTQFDQAMEGIELAKLIEHKLHRKPLWVDVDKPIKKLAWCTGAAQSYIQQAYDNKADAFISGEISEATVHFARENNIHYFAAGHHATERYGVRALGEHLANHFEIQHTFIDIDNPV